MELSLLFIYWTSAKRILPKRLAYVCFLVLAVAISAQAQESCVDLFSEQIRASVNNAKSAKMRLAIQTNGQVKKGSGKYITTRGWEVYRDTLTSKQILENGVKTVDYASAIFKDLKNEDIILDAGCGDGFLSDMLFNQRDLGPYRERSEATLPHYIGITYALNLRSEEFFSDRKSSGRFHIKTGNFFEQVDVGSLVPPGKSIKVITDYYGILSYAERPDLILKQYLELLDAHGTLIIAGHTGISFSQKSKIWDLLGYLKTINGIEVNFINSFETAIVARLTGGPVVIPELELNSVRDVGVLPYIREFKFTGRKYEIIKN